MEPVTSVVVGAAAGVATKELITKAWHSGERWLKSFFKDHEPKAQEAARVNALDFLAELAGRVQAIEESVASIPDAREQIQNALSDPDFSALLQAAMIASGRTDSPEKHKLLARAVSERLLAGPESLIALATNLACDAIPHLSPKHLRCLGIMTLVYGTRPDPFPPQIPPETFGQWWSGWLVKILSPLMPVATMTEVDYGHLVAVSCITYDYVGSRDLKRLLSPPEDSGMAWDAENFLKETDVGQELSRHWKDGMQHAVPTSAGRLLGIYVDDHLTGMKTKITWD